MQIDQITEKRIQKLFENIQDEHLNNPKEKVSNFAGGMYVGALKVLDILNIAVKGRNDFE